MVRDLRRYWQVHRHPLLIFPGVGRGLCSPGQVAQRMHKAVRPMPVSSLERLMVAARKELNIPVCTSHTLRHSFATHLVEAGASLHTVKALWQKDWGVHLKAFGSGENIIKYLGR